MNRVKRRNKSNRLALEYVLSLISMMHLLVRRIFDSGLLITMTSNKAKWVNFCETDTSVPLFFRAEWLNAVCNEWDVLLYEEKQIIVAAFVYHTKAKYGLSAMINPLLTPFQGPWFCNDILSSIPRKKNDQIKKISDYFIKSVPKVFYTHLGFYPLIEDMQSYMWAGYTTKVRNTFRIPATSSAESVWANLDGKLRNNIVRAIQDLEVVENIDTSKHFQILYDTLKRDNIPVHLSDKIFQNIKQGLVKSGWVHQYLCKSGDQVLSSLFFVQDYNSIYLISHGRTADSHRGATALLIWRAIEYAKKNNLTVDFEGTDLQRVEPFYRAFGGELTQYYSISKASNKLVELGLRLIKKF